MQKDRTKTDGNLLKPKGALYTYIDLKRLVQCMCFQQEGAPNLLNRIKSHQHSYDYIRHIVMLKTSIQKHSKAY